MTGLLITGFHRSGTSAVAGQLAAAGVHLGDRLLGVDVGNPHGHHEDLDVVELHDELLAINGLEWWSAPPRELWVPDHCWQRITDIVRRRRTRHTDWAIKDPRLSFFVPLWRHVDPTLRVLVVDRRVDDCVASLIERHRTRAASEDDPAHDAFATDPTLPWIAWATQVSHLVDSIDPARTRRLRFEDRDRVATAAQRVHDHWRIGAPIPAQSLDPSLGGPRETAPPAPPELRHAIDATTERLEELKAL